MSNKIEAFFRKENEKKENVEYVASQRFKDDEGKPIPWKLRHVPTRIIEEIKDRTDYFTDTDKIMGRFAIETTVAAIVFPDLRNKQLQDSYNVKDPEALLYELLNPAELDMLKVEVMQINGYGDDLNALAGEAKN